MSPASTSDNARMVSLILPQASLWSHVAKFHNNVVTDGRGATFVGIRREEEEACKKARDEPVSLLVNGLLAG